MIQAHGVVLESRVAVGHGGMAGVAGFGEKAEVGEAEAPYQGSAGLALPRRAALLGPRMKQHGHEQRRLNADQGQAEGGFAHERTGFPEWSLRG